MRQRTNKTTITQLAKSDKEALKANAKIREMKYNVPNKIELPEINKKFEIEGALLKMLTQKDAYKFTSQKNTKIKLVRPASSNLDRIKKVMKDEYNMIPTDKQIWKGLRKLCIPRIQDFIWKIIHRRLRCGKWFANIKNCEDKQYCNCNEIETIDHILLECKENGLDKIWEWVGKL